jgi:hypothetical protein
MYNYAFYAYLFYRGIRASSTIENALGFASFLKSIYRWINIKAIKDIEKESDLGWVLIFIEDNNFETI